MCHYLSVVTGERANYCGDTITFLYACPAWSNGLNQKGWIQMAGARPTCWLNTRQNVQAMDAAQGRKDPVGERVRALNYLETVLSVIPSAADRLESWFARPTAKCLRNRGIVTLADLVQFINAHGYRWHARITGFGRQRAEQVLAWLVLEQDHLNLLVTGNAYEPKTKQAARVAELLPAVGFSATALNQFGDATQVASGISRMQKRTGTDGRAW